MTTHNLMCDQDHKWYEYIWTSINADSIHNSQHITDPYTFGHIFWGILLFYILQLIMDRKYALIVTVVSLSLFEVHENSPGKILSYGKLTGNVDENNNITKTNGELYKYENDGNSYYFRLNEKYQIEKVDENGSFQKFVKIKELPKYNVTIYRGDSYVNILTDIMAVFVGA